MEDDLNFWNMEDDLNSLENGRRPQFFGKMEDDLNFWNMEDDLNSLENGRQPLFFGKMEDDPNFKVNERRPKF